MTDVRAATLADAGRLADLHARAFEGAVSRPWSESELRALIDTPSSLTVVLVDEKDVCVAFALASVVLETSDLLTLAVNPADQRRGYGARLTRAVMDFAAERGAETMIAEVAATNSSAFRLYASIGFKKTSCRYGYYRMGGDIVDALVLTAYLK